MSARVSHLVATPVPETLWHYTSFEALTKIVESNSIFATDVRFLNDTEELQHSRRLLEEIVQQEEDNIEEISISAKIKIDSSLPEQ